MYYVYVICNEEGKMYVGLTNDIRRRVEEHNSGRNISTRGKKWKVVYYEAYASREDAVQRERRLKQRGQAKRYLKERIRRSIEEVCNKLGAR